MNQYCRYCEYLVTGNGTYCGKKEVCMSDAAAKSKNNCKYFVFNEIDAFDITKKYRPQSQKLSQISIFNKEGDQWN